MGKDDQIVEDASDTSGSTSLATFKKQRATTKGSISRIKRNIEDLKTVPNTIELECRLEILNSYIKQMMVLQTEIEKLDSTEVQKRAELEELAITTKTSLMMLLNKGKRESICQDTSFQCPVIPTSSRLPAVRMPRFNGNYVEYKNFISCFRKLVHNDQSLSAIEKFNYLISCLSDDALRTVKAFQVNEANYEYALARLAERYDNDCLIFQNLISSLFNIPHISKPNASGIRQTIDTVSAVLDSLSTLGTNEDITHSLIIHIVLEKMDSGTKQKWNEQLDFKKLPSWPECAALLSRRCQFLEISENKQSMTDDGKFNKGKFKKENKQSFYAGVNQTEHRCLHCGSDDHIIALCPTFLKLEGPQRFQFVKTNKICINCLKRGHLYSQCKSSKCKICKKSHNTLLHIQRSDKNLNNNGNKAEPITFHSSEDAQYPSNGLHTATFQSMYASNNTRCTILATAIVQIQDKFGNSQLARMLLDSGSQVNLITEELANHIGSRRSSQSINIVGIGKSNTKIKQTVCTVIKSRINEFKFEAEFCVIKTISNHNIDMSICNTLTIPNNLPLADPYFYKSQKIDLLLGAEMFFELLSVGQIKLGENMPILQKTVFGWIISGTYAKEHVNHYQVCHQMRNENPSVQETPISDSLQRFWMVEEVPSQPIMSPEHQLCENHFQKHTMQLWNGRFQVRLPFKHDPSNLGTSYEVAKRRFLSLEKKLENNQQLKVMYSVFMKEYLDLGHMSATTNRIPVGPHYFLPHHGVLKPESTSTKLRVVFDASCKTTTQKSLNDVLMIGPKVQPDLFDTLLKFRLHKYAIVADVTKMYRQVLVNPKDRQFQLILWREYPEEELQIYQLNTVTYGTASAPYLAVRSLVEAGKSFANQHPVGAQVIQNCFYVDDLLTGAETLADLQTIIYQTTSILNSCGFTLSKWSSNHTQLATELSREQLICNSSEIATALGIIWKPSSDEFNFTIKDDISEVSATKRNILSVRSNHYQSKNHDSRIVD